MDIIIDTRTAWHQSQRCWECNSLLRLRPDDLMVMRRCDEYIESHWYGFRCAVCGTERWLSALDACHIPGHVKKQLQARLAELEANTPDRRTRRARILDWIFGRKHRVIYRPPNPPRGDDE